MLVAKVLVVTVVATVAAALSLNWGAASQSQVIKFSGNILSVNFRPLVTVTEVVVPGGGEYLVAAGHNVDEFCVAYPEIVRRDSEYVFCMQGAPPSLPALTGPQVAAATGITEETPLGRQPVMVVAEAASDVGGLRTWLVPFRGSRAWREAGQSQSRSGGVLVRAYSAGGARTVMLLGGSSPAVVESLNEATGQWNQTHTIGADVLGQLCLSGSGSPPVASWRVAPLVNGSLVITTSDCGLEATVLYVTITPRGGGGPVLLEGVGSVSAGLAGYTAMLTAPLPGALLGTFFGVEFGSNTLELVVTSLERSEVAEPYVEHVVTTAPGKHLYPIAVVQLSAALLLISGVADTLYIEIFMPSVTGKATLHQRQHFRVGDRVLATLSAMPTDQVSFVALRGSADCTEPLCGDGSGGDRVALPPVRVTGSAGDVTVELAKFPLRHVGCRGVGFVCATRPSCVTVPAARTAFVSGDELFDVAINRGKCVALGTQFQAYFTPESDAPLQPLAWWRVDADTVNVDLATPSESRSLILTTTVALSNTSSATESRVESATAALNATESETGSATQSLSASLKPVATETSTPTLISRSPTSSRSGWTPTESSSNSSSKSLSSSASTSRTHERSHTHTVPKPPPPTPQPTTAVPATTATPSPPPPTHTPRPSTEAPLPTTSSPTAEPSTQQPSETNAPIKSHGAAPLAPWIVPTASSVAAIVFLALLVAAVLTLRRRGGLRRSSQRTDSLFAGGGGGDNGEYTTLMNGSKYTLDRVLGRGGYGVVFLATRNSDKTHVALKYITCRTDYDRQQAMKEFEVIRRIKGHPNMIQILDFFMNWQEVVDYGAAGRAMGIHGDTSPLQQGDTALTAMTRPRYVAIVTPFYPEGDMRRHLLTLRRKGKKMEERRVVKLSLQAADLLEHFHSLNPPVVHRDIKPENFLTAENGEKLVVTDFGLAFNEVATHMSTQAGSLPYAAPEVFTKHYSPSIDVFSLGCVIYAMCTLRVTVDDARIMFQDVDLPEFADEIRADIVTNGGYTETLCDLILRTLTVDPKQRITAAALASELRAMQMERFPADAQAHSRARERADGRIQ